MNISKFFNRILIYLLIIAIPALVYFVWLSHYYSGDDLQYAMVIEKAVTGKPFYHPSGSQEYLPGFLNQVTEKNLPINPRYLLEYPTSILAVRLWQIFGWESSVIIPILSFRILAGSLGLLFNALTIKKLTKSPLMTAIGTLGIAFSLAYWTYSTHLDQSINMILIFSIVVFILICQFQKARNFDSKNILVPILMAFATLYNFTAVIISGVISLVIALYADELPWKERFFRFMRYNLIYGFVVIIILVSFVAIFQGPQYLLDTNYWASATFVGHPEYNIDVGKDTLRAIIGLEKAQITYPGAEGAFQNYWDQVSGLERVKLLAYYGIVGFLFILPIGYLLLKKTSRENRLFNSKNASLWLLAAIFIAYSLFNWFWDPGYIKYWIIPLICWWIITISIVSEILSYQVKWNLLPVIITIGFISLSFIMNLIGVIGGESRYTFNKLMDMAETLQESPINALFISKGSDLDFYISYITRRDIISLDLINYANNNDVGLVEKILNDHIKSHLQDNGPIYLYGFTEQDYAIINKILNLSQGTQIQPVWNLFTLSIDQVIR